MTQARILWADDEIDLLKPHVLLLEKRGYRVDTVRSGDEAIDQIEAEHFDVVFLDENMPGMTGLEALEEIKRLKPTLPVVMITKSEEEYVMDDAIGAQISDYLIKPVNPNQILLALKKIIDSGRLVRDKVMSSYQRGFQELSAKMDQTFDADSWVELYKELVYWELELKKSGEESMYDILLNQKADANQGFADFIKQNYPKWMQDQDSAPITGNIAFSRKVAPLLRRKERPTVLVLIDNLRFDQWKSLQPLFSKYFRVEDESLYYGILPTATQYARNSFFSGLSPLDISKRFPDKWKNDDEEGGKNKYEEDFLSDLLKRLRLDVRHSYHKILRMDDGKQLAENIKSEVDNNDLVVVVYNFIDMLSHARTDMEVIKELAEDESAYRSLTRSWFEHSPLNDIIKTLSSMDVNLLLTTDHGSIRVKKPVQIVGDRNTTTNLRYKQGRNLKYKSSEVIEFRKPELVGLPKINLSSVYVMSRPEDYFVYPNNQNYYVNFYRNTFQHGGVSMEEMLVPFIYMRSQS